MGAHVSYSDDFTETTVTLVFKNYVLLVSFDTREGCLKPLSNTFVFHSREDSLLIRDALTPKKDAAGEFLVCYSGDHEKQLLFLKQNRCISLNLSKNQQITSDVGCVGVKAIKDRLGDESILLTQVQLHDDLSECFNLQDRVKMLSDLTRAALLMTSQSKNDQSQI